jgi:hypothetical protein
MNATIEEPTETKTLPVKNLGIVVVAARVRRGVDHYEQGQSLDESFHELDLARKIYGSIPEAFQKTFGTLKNQEFGPDDIGTITNNVFVDVKGGGARVVEDKDAQGIYRAFTDRLETKRGYPPGEDQKEAWKAGKETLYNGYYEIEFQVRLVGLDETGVAELLGLRGE